MKNVTVYVGNNYFVLVNNFVKEEVYIVNIVDVKEVLLIDTENVDVIIVNVIFIDLNVIYIGKILNLDFD